MAYAAMLFQFSGDSNLVREWAEATIDLCKEQGVAYYDSWANILHGWALAEQGLPHEGIAQIKIGIDTLHKTDSQARLPYYLTLLAEAYGQDGQHERGLEHLKEALALADKNSDCWYNAESYRLMGEFLLKLGDNEGAESSLKRAQEISRRQKAKVFELRTAISLSHLWQQRNQQAQARRLVTAVFESFSEGFDTFELKKARRHLDLMLQ